MPHAGPYLFCVPGASTLAAGDDNSRVSLWSDIDNLQCTGPATLSLGPGCHQIGVKGCGMSLDYDASITLTGAGITPRTCVQSHGAAPRGFVSTGKYYDNEPDWTPLDAGLVLGQTRMRIVFDPPGDWHVWMPAAIAPWGKCSENHKSMSSEEAEMLVLWPEPIRSGESLLVEGCASTKTVQMMAAPITGHGQAVGVGVVVAGVYVQAAPEPLIDRGWLTHAVEADGGRNSVRRATHRCPDNLGNHQEPHRSGRCRHRSAADHQHCPPIARVGVPVRATGGGGGVLTRHAA